MAQTTDKETNHVYDDNYAVWYQSRIDRRSTNIYSQAETKTNGIYYSIRIGRIGIPKTGM